MFKDLMNYLFGLDVPHSLVQEAVEFYSFAKQKKRECDLSKDEYDHFHFQGRLSYAEYFDKHTIEYIFKRLQNELENDFGYDYSRCSVYPVTYETEYKETEIS